MLLALNFIDEVEHLILGDFSHSSDDLTDARMLLRQVDAKLNGQVVVAIAELSNGLMVKGHHAAIEYDTVKDLVKLSLVQLLSSGHNELGSVLFRTHAHAPLSDVEDVSTLDLHAHF